MNRRLWAASALFGVAVFTRGATFTVTSTADAGAGSLRQAILDANAAAGPDLIHFNLAGPGPYTIAPVTALPVISSPVTLDASTQPGYAGEPLIELNGAGAPAGADGLRITSGNSVLRGLSINRFRGDGVELATGGSNVVENCWIGVGPGGVTGLTNLQNGILLSGSTGNRIGGVNPGIGNRVAYNGADGVAVLSGTNNTVRGNRIFQNAGLGVDLGGNGVQANDATDADTGANLLQNYPVLSRAILHAADTVVTGELRSTPSTVFALEVFANDAPDPAGNGEGQEYLGTFDVLTDAAGLVRFTEAIPVATSRRWIAATATDPAGNTSEFSLSLRALTTLTPNNFVVTSTADTGAGTLRQAITDATNAFNLGDQVTFNLAGAGPHTISPVTALPPLAAPVTLDGYTQPGASPNTDALGFNAALQVVLDGNGAPANVDGLTLTTAGVTVRGLILNRFKGDGIELTAAGREARVEGCVIGLGTDGSDLGQTGSGILINGSAAHVIGGTSPAARNVISGNNRHGIEILGVAATSNTVHGNWIGLGLDGLADRGNGLQGIRCDNAPANLIGGTATGAGNRIAGNDQHGVEFANAGASNNVVLGNWIGLNAADGPLRNVQNGVAINTTGNRIGGVLAGEANWISYNGQRGVNVLGGTNNVIRGNRIHANEGLGLDLGNNNRTANDVGDGDTGANQLQNVPALTSALLSAGQTRVQGTLHSRSNTIHQLDVYASPTPDSTGSGEGAQYLGGGLVTTDAAGNTAFDLTLPVQATGRYVSATATDPFGNTSEFATNVVALADATLLPRTFTVTHTSDSGPGSLRQALLDADTFVAGAPHTIAFNLPGTGPFVIAPETALPTPTTETVVVDGFTQPGARANRLADGSDAVVQIVLDGTDRSVNQGLRFAVPGNTVRGLSVVSFRWAGLVLGAGQDVVEGCFIGLLPDGSPKRNDSSGVLLQRDVFSGPGSSGNRIGGASPGARNVIGGQDLGAAVFLSGGASNNVVIGNYLGTDPQGTAARPNRYGVHITGVGAADNRVGGTAAGEANLISGQTSQGVRIDGGGRNRVLGNRIGTDVTGLLALPNQDIGVLIDASPASTVGGAEPGAGNVIAFNGGSGVSIPGSTSSTNITVRQNAIHDNGSLGIDLSGFGFVDANDVGDTDTGPNQRQNFPVLTAGTVGPSSVRVAGFLDSLPSQTYALEFFANVVADASGHGEGAQFLGQTPVTTDAAGGATFDVTFPVAAQGTFLTATATDPTGNSSEFSAAFKAASTVGGMTFTVVTTNDSGAGSLRQAILDSNAQPTAGNRIVFNLAGPGPHRFAPASALPAITEPVTLDGYSQPGARTNALPDGFDAVIQIHLDAPPLTTYPALTLDLQGAVVRGLAITGFFPGVRMRGTNHTVAGCLIGLAPDGTPRANSYALWLDNARGHTIGGYTPADRNVLAANTSAGLLLTLGQDHLVAGNFIGTDRSGRSALPNGGQGLLAQGSAALTVGGPVPGARNVIGGHSSAGITIDGSSGHLIEGNWIGVAADGASALPNTVGIDLGNAVNARLHGNVVSGNSGYGIRTTGIPDGNNSITGNRIGTDAAGAAALPNGQGGIAVTSTTAVRVGGLTAGDENLIAYNGGAGIRANLGSPTAIRGNRIFENAGLGIDRGLDGVTPNDASDTDGTPNFPVLTAATVGATSVQVSGTLNARAAQSYRLDFYASPAADTTGSGEGAQYLGSSTNTTDGSGLATFTLTFPVAAEGRWITATTLDPSGDSSEFSAAFRADSTLAFETFTVLNTNDSGPGSLRQALLDAGTVSAAENHRIVFAIPGAGPHAIVPLTALPASVEPVTLDGFTQAGAVTNATTDRDFAIRMIHLVGTNLPASASGLRLTAQGSVVRGLVVRGFPGVGIELADDGNRVEGCLILSNEVAGVWVRGGVSNRIGGPLPRERNQILATGPGVLIDSGAGADTVVQGNFLGVAADGALSPLHPAVGVDAASSAPARIGGPGAGEGNRIAALGSPGVLVRAGAGKSIRGNWIATTSALPIDLLGFAVNDPGDPDTGPNNYQNTPVLSSAVATTGGTRVSGTLNSQPNAAFTLDFYTSASNALAVVRYLGATPVTTDAAGNAAFQVVLPVRTPPGVVYGTATAADGSTSEFSNGVGTATEIAPPTFTVTSTADAGPGSLREAMTAANDAYATGPATITFNLPGTGLRTLTPTAPLPALHGGVLVDGFSQPGSSPHSASSATDGQLLVQLHGAAAGPGAHGLVLHGPGIVVRGLIITGFGGSGILATNAPNLRVEECWLGYDGRDIAAGAARLTRAGRLRPHDVPAEELGNEVAITVVDNGFITPFGTPDHRRLIDLIAAGNRSGGAVIQGLSASAGSGIPVLSVLGGRFGLDHFNQPLPNGEIAISIREVSLAEVLGASTYGSYSTDVVARTSCQIAAHNVGIRIVDSRNVTLRAVDATGDGDPALANGWALVVEDSSVIVEDNDFDHNLRGISLLGDVFPSRITGNRIRYPLLGPALSLQGVTGLTLGGADGEANHLGGPLQIFADANLPAAVVFNRFEDFGIPVYLANPLDPPQVTVNADALALDNIPNPASPGWYAVYQSDAEDQQLQYVQEYELAAGVDALQQDIPEAAWQPVIVAPLSVQVFKGSSATEVVHPNVGASDVSVTLASEVALRTDPDTGQTTHVVVLTLRNAGSEVARIRGELQIPGATIDFAEFTDITNTTHHTLLTPDTLQLAGQLAPGESRTTILHVSAAGSVVAQANVSAPGDTNPSNNTSNLTLSPATFTGTPVDLVSVRPTLAFPSTTGDVFQVTVRVENADATAADNPRITIHPVPDLAFVPQNTAGTTQYVAATGIGVVQRATPLDPGQTWTVTPTFRAPSSPRLIIVPVVTSSSHSDEVDTNNAAQFSLIITDPGRRDYGDAPATYGASGASAASALAVPGFQLGRSVGADATHQASPHARGDDADAQGDDDDGVRIVSPLVADQLATIDVTASAPGFLDGWIDYDGDGVFDHRPAAKPNEYLIDALAGHPNPGGSWPLHAGLNRLRFVVPGPARNAATFARFRFSLDGGLLPTGPGGAGEVEDYEVYLFERPADLGDAPDRPDTPGYPTLRIHNGAAHLAGEDGFRLGQRLDWDANGHPNLTAWGDDADHGVESPAIADPDDEDGVTFLGPLNTGQSVPVQVVATILNPGPGRLDAWVDWNADLDWSDPGEQILTNAIVAAGTNLFTVTVPADAADGRTYARFRLSRDGNLTPAGIANNGEVEDYAVTVLGASSLRLDYFQVTPAQLTLVWPFGAQLQQANTVTGTWTVVPGALSPHNVDPRSGARYFRVVRP